MKIRLINRAEASGFHSIEKVYDLVKMGFEKLSIDVVSVNVPHKRVSVKNVIQNLKFLKKSDAINHVTGDITYVALGLKGKVVITIHDIESYWSDSRAKNILIYLFWILLPCIRANKIIVISNETKTKLLRYVPVVSRKIKIIGNPVDPILSIKKNVWKDPTRVLLVGTKENKNIPRCIEAMQGLNVVLIIVGRLSSYIERCLLDSNLSFENYSDVSKEKLYKLYATSNVLCFPSLYEGFGMPIIEAQALGRPVITSNTGAMKEIAGTSCHLVDPLDIGAIRRGICKLVQDVPYRRSLVRKGTVNIEKYHFMNIAEQYLGVYSELMD